MLLDLADVCRKTGLEVVEVPGWKTRTTKDDRGRPHDMGDVRTIVCHHTAGPAKGDAPSLLVVKNGRKGTNPLSGPLAHLVLSRSGIVYVVAAGRCNHAGKVLRDDWSNEHSIGIEAEATGGLHWDGAPIETYALLAGTLANHYGGASILGHKEVCDPPGRKSDPALSMPKLRSLAEETTMPLSKADIELFTTTPIAVNLNGPTPKVETITLKGFIQTTDEKLDQANRKADVRHAELLAAIAALTKK